MAALSGLELKYFDLSGWNGLAGLGGGIRFFLLTQGIQFQDVKVTMDEWKGGMKQELMKSGESPTGHLPIVKLGGKAYIESMAILRLLSRKLGLYGQDVEADYLIDMAADAVVEFRTAWHDAALGTPELKDAYTSAPDKRKHFYSLMDTIIARGGGSGAHVIGSSTTLVDAALFALLWDDVAMFKGDEYLWTHNPKLTGFFQAYMKQPMILAWCKDMREDVVEGHASG